jgi:hypothetical protein
MVADIKNSFFRASAARRQPAQTAIVDRGAAPVL